VLPVMLRFTTVARRTSLTGRLFGGAGLVLLLVGVVIVPLWSALSLCSMPCCHHASSNLASATSQDPCCTINPGDAGNDAVAVSAAAIPQRTFDAAEPAAAFTVASALNPPVTADLATHVPHPLDRPLHILNSVFLI
jgi:hypothetical protein